MLPKDSRQKIRVAHVIGGLGFGGAETLVVEILNGLDSRLIEKHLVTLQKTEILNGRPLNSDIRTTNIALKRWGQIGCILRLARMFRARQIHIVQAHMLHTNLYVAIAAKLANVPVAIVTEHGLEPWKCSIHHFIERRIISPLVDMHIAVSEDIRRDRVETSGLQWERIRVITPCVMIPDQPCDYRDELPVRIGTVGRMVTVKDYGTLLLAFKNVLDSGLDAELVFIGDGPERGTLTKIIRELQLESKVILMGFRKDVHDLLRSLDVFSLSSISEGMPVALLEAMSLGLPVAATQAGGIPEVIEHGKSGLLFPVRDASGLGRGLISLATDAALRRNIGEEGRRRVLSLFGREAICQRYERLYSELLQTAGASCVDPSWQY